VGDKKCIRNFSGEISWKSPLGRPRRKWKDNIKKNLRERVEGWEAERTGS
jgi:hypothetical protein